MFQTVIAVLIGLSFLYFILAVLCSGVKEFIAAKLNFRAATLESAIGRMLANGESAAPPGSGQSSPAGAPPVSNLGTAFYSHPLIQGLAYKDKNPSYIPTRYFSTVLEQILRARQIGSADYAALIHNLPEGQLKEKLSALAERGGNEAEAVRKEIEIWFDSTMDRVSEWYKRQAQKIVLAIAVVLAIALNADSFTVFRALWQNSTLRDNVVVMAAKAKSDMSPEQAEQQLKALEQLKQLPLGWTGISWKDAGLLWWLLKFFGLAVTAFAATLGAPFWFDAMNKLINMRLTGSQPSQAAPVQAVPVSTVIIQPEAARSFAAKAR